MLPVSWSARPDNSPHRWLLPVAVVMVGGGQVVGRGSSRTCACVAASIRAACFTLTVRPGEGIHSIRGTCTVCGRDDGGSAGEDWGWGFTFYLPLLYGPIHISLHMSGGRAARGTWLTSFIHWKLCVHRKAGFMNWHELEAWMGQVWEERMSCNAF